MQEKIAETLEQIVYDALKEWMPTEEHIKAVCAALRSPDAAQALSGICVEVEELEWREADRVSPYSLTASTPFGSYNVGVEAGVWFANYDGFLELKWATLTDARTERARALAIDTCEKHYRSLISSCLKTRTVEEVRAEGAREERERLADLAGGCFVAVNTPEGISLGSRRPLSDWLRSQSTTEEG